MNGSQFDANYYAQGCGQVPYGRNPIWLTQFGIVAQHIGSFIGPATVLDAGCAYGLLVEALRARGIEAYGVDISDYAISQVSDDIKPFCRQGSVSAPFARRYDLITCIEVLEHMPAVEAEAAIANFCAHSSDILFSSSPHDYTEATHINVHPMDHWAKLFAAHGFFRDTNFDASCIAPWATRFVQHNVRATDLVQAYEQKLWDLQQENSQLRAELSRTRNGSAADSTLQTVNVQLRAEVARQTVLLQRYENGRFMRLMRWLKGEGRA